MAVRAGARRYQDEPVAADAKLPGIAVDALLGQREWRARERAAAGDLWQAHALVFTTSVGTAYESHTLRRDFRRVTAAAGLGVRWVPKELRTSFVSMMSYQGVPVEEIARLLRPVITTGAEVMDHYEELAVARAGTTTTVPVTDVIPDWAERVAAAKDWR